jgi:hypothetical protein
MFSLYYSCLLVCFFFPNFFLSRVVRWFTVRCPRWSTERRSPWVCLYDFCFLKISQSYSLDCCWLLFCGWASGFCSFMFSVYKKNTHTHTQKQQQNPNSESGEKKENRKKRYPDVRRDHKSPLLFFDRSSTSNLFSFTKKSKKKGNSANYSAKTKI